jgi:Uri superfamily endonuclease
MKGIYVLMISLKYSICVRVGALGDLTFPAGLYAYVGSAQTGIELRVARHQRKEKRLFWHIDYLLNDESAKVEAVYVADGLKADECLVAHEIEANGAAPIARFGCSDCRCISHLFQANDFGFLKTPMQMLEITRPAGKCR